ncbi:MAG: 50S ribosomal protein L4 [Spirochaetes bacterium]|nr:50S ribosomal protein L4 [Spirochaetota bacterium]
MKAPVKNLKNEKVGEIDLSDSVFAAAVKDGTVYDAIRNSLNNKRQGNASTLNRKLVSGTTKKPWRQKGTGRARAGSNKSGLWSGGAVIFGPMTKDWRYDIPRKIKQNAFRSALTQLAASGKLIVIDGFAGVAPKTKPLAESLSKIAPAKKVLLVVDAADKAAYETLRRAAKNIARVKITHVDSVEIQDVFYTDELVITQVALEAIQKRLS